MQFSNFSQMRKKQVGVILGFLILTLSGCTSVDNSDTPKPEGKAISKPTISPKKQFEDKVFFWLRAKLYYLQDNAWSNAGLSLQHFVYDYSIEIDDALEFASITLRSQIKADSDLGMGSQVGIFNNSGNFQAKVFCAGQNYNSLDTFSYFVSSFLNDQRNNFEELDGLVLPSKGIQFTMEWREVKTVTDKFGTQTEKYRPIGVDMIGLTSEEIVKIVDPDIINLYKFNELSVPKKARNSWHSGLCAEGQRINN
jgi:hypothetical protein